MEANGQKRTWGRVRFASENIRDIREQLTFNIFAVKIQTVTLGSNFTVRIFYHVRLQSITMNGRSNVGPLDKLVTDLERGL